MVLFPNCKINLGLHITGKRPDGYHNIETIFYPLPLKDALEIIRLPTKTGSPVQFSCSGLSIPVSETQNLCVQAWHLLKKDFPALPSVQMHLHKTIPMGAGLGGGSADAAFTLKALNEKFQLHLSIAQLIDYALQLGSDCPFFINNSPAFATGRGEILTPVSLDLNQYHFVLVNPGIHINTAWAFSKIIPTNPPQSLLDSIIQPIASWKNDIENDFEPVIGGKYPEIENIKNKLYKEGALYASMSGSGSTVFGLFEQKPATINFPAHYQYFIL